MKTLIVGSGEVGTSLMDVVSPYHETFIRDIEDMEVDGIEVLHICYPDHDDFVQTTKKYIEQYKPKVTIINSSVQIGTTEKVGDVIYSPVRGRHPNLAKEIKLYPKVVAGKDYSLVQIAANYFRKCDLNVVESDNPKAYEFCKLISNIHMGLEIAWRQEVQRMMKYLNINSDEYELWEKDYSEGYLKLGQTQLIRPRMNPGKIGGHCILPCTDILLKSFDSKALEFIKESNNKVGG